MDNYIAVVFNTDRAASDGLHALWKLDHEGMITVHGAAVIHRDPAGHVEVATKHTDPGLRTALGVGIGAVLGALAGPIGAVSGGAVGGLIGLTVDTQKSGEREEAANEASSVMQPGQAAVVAEVSEDETTTVDAAMTRLGGSIFRRDKTAVHDMSLYGNAGEDWMGDLLPYDYDPRFTDSPPLR